MSRIRTIKPGFFPNEKLSALPAETHLLAAGLLTYADDDGYFNANVQLIQAAVFPLRALNRTVSAMMSSLASIKYIRLGKGSDGRRYAQIVNFGEHQHINRKTPSKIAKLSIVWDETDGDAQLPLMPGNSSLTDGSVSTHCALSEDSHQEGNGKEGKGKELKAFAPATPTPDLIKPDKSKKSEPDPRKAEIREAIKVWYRQENSGTECPWDASEEKALSAVLASVRRDVSVEKLVLAVEHRFLSAESRSVRPRQWLAMLLSYLDAPLDRFGKPDYAARNAWRQAKAKKAAEATPAPSATELAPMPAPTAGDQQAWLAVLSRLRAQVNQRGWETWLRPTRLAGISAEKLRVLLPTDEFRLIGEKWPAELKTAVDEFFGGAREIEFATVAQVRQGGAQ